MMQNKKVVEIKETNISEIKDNHRGDVILLNEEGKQWLKSKEVIVKVNDENLNSLLNRSEYNIDTTIKDLVSNQQTTINNLPHLVNEGVKQGLKDLLTHTKTPEKLSKKEQRDLEVKESLLKANLDLLKKHAKTTKNK